MKPDPYQTLGVARDASEDEIKRAYRKLAQQHHPDRNAGSKESEEKFKEINDAYQRITNPQANQPEIPGFADFEFDFSEGIFGSVFEGINNIFGGGMPRTPKGPNVSAVVNLTFEESCFGCTKEVRIVLDEACQTCEGMGATKGNFTVCGPCRGTGQNTFKQGPFVVSSGVCRTCNGKRISITQPCEKCTGSGQVRADRTHQVAIPPCVQHGAGLQVQGLGGSAPAGGKPGDLVVKISVQKHHEFKRDGVDVHAQCVIGLKEALLGGEKTVRTIHRDTLVKIPPLTKPGTKLSLKDLGAKVGSGSGEGFGRHILSVVVEFPESLTDEQKQAIEQIL